MLKSSSYVCRRLGDRVSTIAYFVYILFRENVRAVNSTREFALLCTFQWLGLTFISLFFIVGLSRGPSTLVCRVANKARTIRLCTVPISFYFPCAHIIPNSVKCMTATTSSIQFIRIMKIRNNHACMYCNQILYSY